MVIRDFEVFDPIKPTGEFVFDRPPSDAKAALICLHGFTGSPWETRPVAEYMFSRGYACFCPLLPGHGAKDPAVGIRLMNNLSATEMFEFVREYIRSKRAAGYRHIFLYGSSMGGILTLAMAGEGLVDAAAETVAPLHLPRVFKWYCQILAHFNHTIISSKPKAEHGWSYEFLSGRSAMALFAMMEYALSKVGQINIPICGIYSKHDILTMSTGKYLGKLLGPKIQMQWFNKSGHVMIFDKETEQIKAALAVFYDDQISR